MPKDATAYEEALYRFKALEGDPKAHSKLTIADILRAAEEATGVTAKEIQGRSRAAVVCMVRNEVCAIAQEHGFSLAMIGHALGRRDHSTIFSAIKSAKMRAARARMEAVAMRGEP